MSDTDDESIDIKETTPKKGSRIRITEEARAIPSSNISLNGNQSPRNIPTIKKPKFGNKKSILPDYTPKILTPRQRGHPSATNLPIYGNPQLRVQASNINLGAYPQQKVRRLPSIGNVNRRNVPSQEPEFLDTTPEGDTPEGNYVIQNLEYGYDIDEVQQQLNELEQDCTGLAGSANFLATVFRTLDTLMFICVIALSVVSSIFALNGSGSISQSTSSYISGIMSICAAGIEGLRSSFSLAERGKTFKDIYLRTLVVARKARALRRARISRNDVEKNIEKLREKLINLQLSMYETSLPDATTPTSYAERIEKGSDNTGSNEPEQTNDFIESTVPRSRIPTQNIPSEENDIKYSIPLGENDTKYTKYSIPLGENGIRYPIHSNENGNPISSGENGNPISSGENSNRYPNVVVEIPDEKLEEDASV